MIVFNIWNYIWNCSDCNDLYAQARLFSSQVIVLQFFLSHSGSCFNQIYVIMQMKTEVQFPFHVNFNINIIISLL